MWLHFKGIHRSIRKVRRRSLPFTPSAMHFHTSAHICTHLYIPSECGSRTLYINALRVPLCTRYHDRVIHIVGSIEMEDKCIYPYVTHSRRGLPVQGAFIHVTKVQPACPATGDLARGVYARVLQFVGGGANKKCNWSLVQSA